MYTATLSIDNVLSPQTVSLQAELTARQLIEAVFVQFQTDASPDPFKFTIDYFGYDHYQGVTTYLGYFIVSINDLVSDANNYWDLVVNSKPASLGMDSYLVQPGDRVELKWITAPAASKGIAGPIQRARTRRAKSRAS